MNVAPVQTLETDLHRLERRFAPLRLMPPPVVEILSRSIERSGQWVPMMAVAEAEARWVLIDGYRRVQALSRCGQDTGWVELWEGDVAGALLRALAGQGRAWEPIEEAGLMGELISVHGLSQHQIARQSGRDVSWVSRRLALIEALPEAALAAVYRGELSSWAATRIVAPLARANSAHAQALLERLRSEPLSTRELSLWFGHYQQATRPTRERLIAQPRLFLQAHQARQQAVQAWRLRAGPEGAWRQDLARIGQLCQQLGRQVPRLFDAAQPLSEQRALYGAFVQAKRQLTALEITLKEHYPDAARADPANHPGPA